MCSKKMWSGKNDFPQSNLRVSLSTQSVTTLCTYLSSFDVVEYTVAPLTVITRSFEGVFLVLYQFLDTVKLN